MRYLEFVWREDDNLPHLEEHGVTPDEAEYVVKHARPDDLDVSETSGDPVAFGYTPTDRYLCVIYHPLDDVTAYVVTAFDVPPRRLKRRR